MSLKVITHFSVFCHIVKNNCRIHCDIILGPCHPPLLANQKITHIVYIPVCMMCMCRVCVVLGRFLSPPDRIYFLLFDRQPGNIKPEDRNARLRQINQDELPQFQEQYC